MIFQIVLFWLLLYLGLYFNQGFIPNSLMWKDNKPRTDTAGLAGSAAMEALILLAEAAIWILLVYLINKLFLGSAPGKNNAVKVLKWTIRANIILSLCFIGILIWGSFRNLW